MDAFDLADKYRTPVMILADGMMGQMMEPVIFKKPKPRQYSEKFMLHGAGTWQKQIYPRSSFLIRLTVEEHNWKLARKYQVITKNETLHEEYKIEDARFVIVAYGTAARIAKGAIKRLRDTWYENRTFPSNNPLAFPGIEITGIIGKN